MTIQYCSDLHLEFTANSRYLLENRLVPLGDILILAGDITYLSEKYYRDDFFDYVSESFKQTYWVPGNHEFYNGYDLSEFDKPIKIQIRSNVHLVNNQVFNHNGIDFFFTTLWTELEQAYIPFILNGVNDFFRIKYKGEVIQHKEYEQQHFRSVAFLEEALTNSKANKKVVVTHHVPSQLCNHSDFMFSDINSAFIVGMDDLITKHDINYWIYGHHHRNILYQTIGKTKLITNQLGYVHMGESKNFNLGAAFDL
jgi:predicted phosphohydrolase